MIDYLNPNYGDLPGLRSAIDMYTRDSRQAHTPEVSVITPYFNTEELFTETVNSLLTQSLQNWEWIIIDDGSSDNTSVERLSTVAKSDSRIKVFRQINSGPGAARNAAFAKARAKYICLLDSDDMIEPTYLEKCCWFLESNPEFAFCNSHSVVFGDQEYLWTTGFETGKNHLLANSGPPISVIRSSAFKDAGGFDGDIKFGHEDWDFWLRMAKAGHWGYTICEFLQWYRKRGAGRYEQIMGTVGINENFEKKILKRYSELEENFPQPSRRHPSPYEEIENRLPIKNPLSSSKEGHRFLFIIPWMVVGGADRVNLDLIEGLLINGHSVTVCATLPADHRWESEFANLTPDVFILPNFLHISDYPRFLSYLIHSRGVDVVIISGSTLGYQLLPYLRANSPNATFIDMCHVEELHWLNGGHPRYGVGYQDLLDLNITTTQHLADWMKDRGADIDRIKVLYTGIRPPKSLDISRNQVKGELGIGSNTPIIVFAGRICEQKRPEVLAKILRELKAKGVIFQALIIGDGELKGSLENLIREYQLMDVVQILGSVSHGRWLQILSASDILLMPSKYEGISIALLESLSAGVVPVVAKVGGQDEIISAEVGVLVPHGEGEIESYTKALYELLTDHLKLQEMSRKSKDFARSTLSWQGMICKFLKIVEKANDLRKNDPRALIPPKLAIELTSQAIECKRLSDAVDWLWSAKKLNPVVGSMDVTFPPELQSATKFLVCLSQTRIGRKVLRSYLLKIISRCIYRLILTSSSISKKSS